MKNENIEKCCVVSCELPLGEQYWNNQYKANSTGWNLGQVSPPIKEYIDQVSNKNVRILIPGCGNSYEAEYLLQNGFTNVTVIDIAPILVEILREKYKSNPNIKIIHGDFFQHHGEYDLIIEQTFFCAINPEQRKSYVEKMYQLLAENGKLVGLLFDREFETEGPPFGGCKCKYVSLFEQKFTNFSFEKCYNSFEKRKDTELFISVKK